MAAEDLEATITCISHPRTLETLKRSDSQTSPS